MASVPVLEKHHKVMPVARPGFRLLSTNVLLTEQGPVLIEGPVAADELWHYRFDEGLNSFRPAQQQHKALVDIASMRDGMVYIARRGKTVVGYVTFVPPDEYMQWGNDKIPGLLEMGAIEISRAWRRFGIGIALLRQAFKNDALEERLIISMEFAWHWDLEGTNLSSWEYRNMLVDKLSGFGFELWHTDDPDIQSHPSNTLMVRIGRRTSREDTARLRWISCNRRQILGESLF